MIHTVFAGDPYRFVRASVIYHQPFDAVEAWDGPWQIAQRYRQSFGFVVAGNLDNQLWQKTALELGRLDNRASIIVRLRCKRFSPRETIFPPSHYPISAAYVRASPTLRAGCAPNAGRFRNANVRSQSSSSFPETPVRIAIDGRNLASATDGIGRFVHNAINALAAQGADVAVYAPGTIGAHYDIPSGVSVRSAGVKGSLARTLWGQSLLPCLARRDRVEVLWGPSHRLPFVLDGRIARVVTIHDLVWLHAARTMRTRTLMGERLLMKPALRAADIIVADSTATASALTAEFPWLKSPVRTVAPGTAALPASGDVSSLEPLGITKPYALFVGTLEPRKNLANLIRAYGLLPAGARGGCDLVIVGAKGWKQTGLADLVRAGRLEANIKFTGFVDDGVLATLYANCLFLAMPSLYEGFGFPIVEAQSFGKPVLTSNTSSMPEVAGDSAVLVDPNDPAGIAAAFGRLCKDAEFRNRIAAGARSNAGRFTWENHAMGMLQIFEEAIRQRRKTDA
ncbi:glycosyltransferase family 1 protein [Mesorhizobium sp. B2-6-2]|uniref:glycosyltransferase family 4 protein n=1 Tax=Mesorhizobium sp. B2-6-2 TaxID=2589915 RepID=UPI001FEF8D74|nr:glycosyltransferase family 1 protein [Mesorhizobium sp. B2-6-2]